MAVIPFVPGVKILWACAKLRLAPHVHMVFRAQRFPLHVQAMLCLLFPGRLTLKCLHNGDFVLVQSPLGWEYSLHLTGHMHFPMCDMHPMLINGDSKYKSLCAQHNESQRAISFSVPKNSYFPLPGDWLSVWARNGINNRISELKALFKSGLGLEWEWMNLQEPSAICCLLIKHVVPVC
jgi:hypothetical protein